MNEENEMNRGVQPLDALMARRGLDNHDLVAVSVEQLTHKQVQKARQGRQLTLKLMQKVARALNVAAWNRLPREKKERYVEYIHRDLFNYAKGYNPTAADPNEELYE